MESIQWDIANTDIAECPVTFIAPESWQIVEQIESARSVQAATEAVPFGPDSGQWPAKYFEIVQLLRSEHNRVENGRIDAEQNV